MRSSLSFAVVLLILSSLTVVSLSPESSSAYSDFEPIYIDGDGDLIAQNGVSGGTGTEEDPYIIEGYNISATSHQQDPLSGIGVYIRNTAAHLVIRDSVISGETGSIRIESSSNISLVGLQTTSPLVSITMLDCRDMVLDGCAVLSTSQTAVLISNTSDISAIECEFESQDAGTYVPPPITTVRAVACNDVVFVRNNFSGNGLFSGFEAQSCVSLSLEMNEFVGCRHGLALFDSSTIILEANNVSGSEYDGLGMSECTGITLGDNCVTACGSDGAAFYSCGNIDATGNDLSGNAGSGMEFIVCTNASATGNTVNSNGLGINIHESDDVTLTGNAVKGNYIAIPSYACSNLTISRNDVSDSIGNGIAIIESGGTSTIESNSICSNGDDGVSVQSCRNVSIVRNSIENNRETGIRSASCYDLFIAENNVSHNTHAGIWLEVPEGDRSEIIWNKIAWNDGEGLFVVSYAVQNPESPIIHHNCFMDNRVQAMNFIDDSVWDDGYPWGGNYWSGYFWGDEYSGPDQNENGADGIGDYPVLIDTVGRDRYPLMSWPDATPPRTTLSTDSTVSEDGWWHLSSVTVEMTAVDVYTGVEKTMYRVDSGDWIEYQEAFEIDEDGWHTVEYFSEDLAGNTEAINESMIGIDRAPPTLEIDQLDGTVFRTGTVKISWDCVDETSGLDRCEYSLDGGAFVTVYDVSIELSGLESGEHSIVVRVIDNAGHSADARITFTVEPSGDFLAIAVIAGVALVAAVACLVILLRRRGEGDERKPDEDSREPPDSA